MVWYVVVCMWATSEVRTVKYNDYERARHLQDSRETVDDPEEGLARCYIYEELE